MSPFDKSQSESLDEELVAYLDGQLDSESARQVEQRLAGEATVRRRLQQLAQSWDMLDQLPHAVVDETFTRTTVEMVAVAAEEEMAKQQAVAPRDHRWRWLWAGAAAAAAALVGFLAAAAIWSDPNEKLLRDLPVIENFEVYKQTGSIEFLRKLDDESLFSDETADTPAAREAMESPIIPKSLDQRRELLARMTAQQKDDLRAKFDKFESLSADAQEGYRNLDAQLNRDTQGNHLRQIMIRFHEWLKTLLTTDRAELLGAADTSYRIAQIRKLRHEQEARLVAQAGGSKLLPHDVDALHLWLEKFAAHHEADLLKDLPAARKEQIQALDDAKRHRAIVLAAWQHWRSGSIGKTVVVSDAELRELMSDLSSPDARGALESESIEQRIQTVSSWIQAVPPRWWFPRQGGGGGPAVSEEELNKFFQGLLSNERELLLNMPRDEMNRKLRSLYFQHKYPGRGPGRDRDRDRPQRDTAPAKAAAPTGTEDAPPLKPIAPTSEDAPSAPANAKEKS